jgi:hypothetical protein
MFNAPEPPAVGSDHECKAAQARAFEENQEYILALTLAETPIPGIVPTTGYLRMEDTAVDEIVGILLKKLGQQIIPGAMGFK